MFFAIENILHLKQKAVERAILEPDSFLTDIYPILNCDIINTEISEYGDKILTFKCNKMLSCKMYLGRRYQDYLDGEVDSYLYNSVVPFINMSHYHRFYCLHDGVHRYTETVMFDSKNPLVFAYYYVFKYILIPLRNKKLKELNYLIPYET